MGKIFRGVLKLVYVCSAAQHVQHEGTNRQAERERVA